MVRNEVKIFTGAFFVSSSRFKSHTQTASMDIDMLLDVGARGFVHNLVRAQHLDTSPAIGGR